MVVSWARRSPGATSVALMKTLPLLSTETITASSWVAMALVSALGRFTWTPCCIMGAVTMKMTRSTSITSTRGVTLICDMVPRSLLFLLPSSMGWLLLLGEGPLDDVQELGGEVVHGGDLDL